MNSCFLGRHVWRRIWRRNYELRLQWLGNGLYGNVRWSRMWPWIWRFHWKVNHSAILVLFLLRNETIKMIHGTVFFFVLAWMQVGVKFVKTTSRNNLETNVHLCLKACSCSRFSAQVLDRFLSIPCWWWNLSDVGQATTSRKSIALQHNSQLCLTYRDIQSMSSWSIKIARTTKRRIISFTLRLGSEQLVKSTFGYIESRISCSLLSLRPP